jgi:magnesium-transporting ATPase (P-type)
MGDGKRTEIPAEVLVPGDLVLLEAGDGVPADIRVILGNVNPVKVLHDSSLDLDSDLWRPFLRDSSDWGMLQIRRAC